MVKWDALWEISEKISVTFGEMLWVNCKELCSLLRDSLYKMVNCDAFLFEDQWNPQCNIKFNSFSTAEGKKENVKPTEEMVKCDTLWEIYGKISVTFGEVLWVDCKELCSLLRDSLYKMVNWNTCPFEVNETLKATSNFTCFFTAEGKKENVKDYRRNGKMRCNWEDLWGNLSDIW